MKKSKKISLSLNKKVVSNLQSNAVKGGSGHFTGYTLQCERTAQGGTCGPQETRIINGCTVK